MFDSIDIEIFQDIAEPATVNELDDIDAVINSGMLMLGDEFSKELSARFPFIFSDTGYNHLYDIYDGWLTAFSVPFLIHVRRALSIDGADAHILDMKEKYGTLRTNWGYTYDYAELVTTMYEILSGYYCSHCGQFGAKLTQTGWITALCKDCWNTDNDGEFGSPIPLEPLTITSYNDGKTLRRQYLTEPWVKQIDELSDLSAMFAKTWQGVNSSQWSTM